MSQWIGKAWTQPNCSIGHFSLGWLECIIILPDGIKLWIRNTVRIYRTLSFRSKVS